MCIDERPPPPVIELKPRQHWDHAEFSLIKEYKKRLDSFLLTVPMPYDCINLMYLI